MASNFYGDSDITPLEYFTPGQTPIAIGIPYVFSIEEFVVINWNATFSMDD
jgi:hypothetical protein